MKKLMKKLYALSNVAPVMALALLVTAVAEQTVSQSACMFLWGEPTAPNHLIKK